MLYSNPLGTQEFEKYVSEVLDEFHTPGLSIAIIYNNNNNNNTWSKGFGYSDLSSETKVTPRTLFYTGSTTKSFTSAITSKLVYSKDEKYKDITWTTRLADLIREDFVLQDEYATNHITLVDALSHRTGMPRHDISWINGNPSIRDQVRQMRYLPMHNELRAKWEYCNVMYTAVSHACETFIGEPMHKILKDWIWEPLGMRETFYRLQDALECANESEGVVSLSQSYLWDEELQTHVDVPLMDIPPENGAGGMISNVLDYTHWIRRFLDPSKESNPLGPEAVADISAAHMAVAPSWLPWTTHTYGLGLRTITYRGYQFTGHMGGIGGYFVAMYWCIELQWGFVAFQNSLSFALYAVHFKLMDDFLDSVGARGGAFDMRAKGREMEREGTEKLKNGKKSVYPNAPDTTVVGSALLLAEYEGTYHHPAYHDISLRVSDASGNTSSGASLQLDGVGSDKNFLSPTWTFHHMSGENWWVHFKIGGPSSFLLDEFLKAKFDVGVDGKVRGLSLQAEKALDELAWFEKVN